MTRCVASYHEISLFTKIDGVQNKLCNCPTVGSGTDDAEMSDPSTDKDAAIKKNPLTRPINACGKLYIFSQIRDTWVITQSFIRALTGDAYGSIHIPNHKDNDNCDKSCSVLMS